MRDTPNPLWRSKKTQNLGMKVVLSQISLIPRFCVGGEGHIHGAVAGTRGTVEFLAGLLAVAAVQLRL
jgi:hypothetical protein